MRYGEELDVFVEFEDAIARRELMAEVAKQRPESLG